MRLSALHRTISEAVIWPLDSAAKKDIITKIVEGIDRAIEYEDYDAFIVAVGVIKGDEPEDNIAYMIRAQFVPYMDIENFVTPNSSFHNFSVNYMKELRKFKDQKGDLIPCSAYISGTILIVRPDEATNFDAGEIIEPLSRALDHEYSHARRSLGRRKEYIYKGPTRRKRIGSDIEYRKLGAERDADFTELLEILENIHEPTKLRDLLANLYKYYIPPEDLDLIITPEMTRWFVKRLLQAGFRITGRRLKDIVVYKAITTRAGKESILSRH